jgi:hypothetical protein
VRKPFTGGVLMVLEDTVTLHTNVSSELLANLTNQMDTRHLYLTLLQSFLSKYVSSVALRCPISHSFSLAFNSVPSLKSCLGVYGEKGDFLFRLYVSLQHLL